MWKLTVTNESGAVIQCCDFGSVKEMTGWIDSHVSMGRTYVFEWQANESRTKTETELANLRIAAMCSELRKTI